MNKSYFKEEQYFSSPWFWAFLIVLFTFTLLPTVVAIYSGVVLEKPMGENPDYIVTLFITLAIIIVVYLVVILFFRKMRLDVEIKQDGLYYRYVPFINKYRHFLKEEIKSFEVRKYRPIKDYSGWGIRNSWGKAGTAFTVKGNMGLQLYLVNGKKVLFGTQRGDALTRAMAKMMQGDR